MEETGGRLLERADPGKQESLQSEVVPDPMEGEQTWPTEEELALAQRGQWNCNNFCLLKSGSITSLL